MSALFAVLAFAGILVTIGLYYIVTSEFKQCIGCGTKIFSGSLCYDCYEKAGGFA